MMLLVSAREGTSVSVHTTFETGISVVVIGGNVIVVAIRGLSKTIIKRQIADVELAGCLGQKDSRRNHPTEGRDERPLFRNRLGDWSRCDSRRVR